MQVTKPVTTKCIDDKSFIRPHLYDQTFNYSFHQKFESIQYNACLTNTGAIVSTLRDKLYQDLGFESLYRRWYRTLCCFYKIYKNKQPLYLFNLIPRKISSYYSRNKNHIPLFKVRHDFFKNSFFRVIIIERNSLDTTTANNES